MSLFEKLTASLGAAGITVLILLGGVLLSVLSWVIGVVFTGALIFYGVYMVIKAHQEEKNQWKMAAKRMEGSSDCYHGSETVHEKLARQYRARQARQSQLYSSPHSNESPKIDYAALNRERDLHDPNRYTIK